ncbi:hypothetical protein BDR03DRAFT_987299 [Suillus americanus]|nr:hypothetical protein BDR03DRAFT_987299 [Suillus americanus]
MVRGVFDTLAMQDNCQEPIKLSKSVIRRRKRQAKREEQYQLRVAEKRALLFAKYQAGTMKRNKQRAERDAYSAVLQEDTGLSKSDIRKKLRRQGRARRKALIAAEQDTEKAVTQILADTQALLVEKEAELLAMRDVAQKDALLAAEKIAFLEERMDDLLVVLKEGGV